MPPRREHLLEAAVARRHWALDQRRTAGAVVRSGPVQSHQEAVVVWRLLAVRHLRSLLDSQRVSFA